MPTRELTVAAIMDPHPVCVGPAAPIREVMALLNGRRIGSAAVVAGGRLVGIFTERDLLKRVAAAVPGWRDYPVSDWMTPDPHTIAPHVGYTEAAAAMQRLRVRHVPVADGGEVVGVDSALALMARREEDLLRRVELGTMKLALLADLATFSSSTQLNNIYTNKYHIY